MLPTAGRYVDGSGMNPTLGGADDVPPPPVHGRGHSDDIGGILRDLRLWPPRRAPVQPRPSLVVLHGGAPMSSTPDPTTRTRSSAISEARTAPPPLTEPLADLAAFPLVEALLG